MPNYDESFLVTGPGTDGRSAPTWGSAISLAQTLASKRDAHVGTWYIRNPAGDVVLHVTRQEDGVVTTVLSNGAARVEAKQTLAEVVDL